MSGFNLPPGCRVRDIPGCRPEDEEHERQADEVYAIIPSCTDEQMTQLIAMRNKDFELGYKQATNDAAEAQLWGWTMSFNDFNRHPQKKGWYRLSLVRGTGEHEELTATILQWEPENKKWYKPEFLEGRDECGYLDRVGLGSGAEWRIFAVSSI